MIALSASEDVRVTLEKDARAIVDLGRKRGLTVACAESLTGGLVCDALVRVPGASRVLNGGIVAYATVSKETVLGVPREVLADHGPVHSVTAAAMAKAAADKFSADLGCATTGVAGPEPQDGVAVGTVFVAVWSAALATSVDRRDRPDLSTVVEYHFTGVRSNVRLAAVAAVLNLLRVSLEQNPDHNRG